MKEASRNPCHEEKIRIKVSIRIRKFRSGVSENDNRGGEKFTDSYGVPRYPALVVSFFGLFLWHAVDNAAPGRYSGSGCKSVICKKRPCSCRGGSGVIRAGSASVLDLVRTLSEEGGHDERVGGKQ